VRGWIIAFFVCFLQQGCSFICRPKLVPEAPWMRVTFAHVYPILEQYWHRPSQQSQGVAMFVFWKGIANAPHFGHFRIHDYWVFWLNRSYIAHISLVCL
jgi:hypothetical protein